MEKVVDQLTSSLAHADEDTPAARRRWPWNTTTGIPSTRTRSPRTCAGPSATSSGRPSSDTSRSSATSSLPIARSDDAARAHAHPGRPRRPTTRLIERPHVAAADRGGHPRHRPRGGRPHRRRDSPPSASASSAPRTWSRSAAGCDPIPAMHFATRDEVRDDGRRCRSPGRTRRSRPGSGSCPRRRASSSRCPSTRSATRRSPTTAQPAMDGSRPGPVRDQHLGAHDPPALRGPGARVPRGRAGAPPAARDRQELTGLPGVPAPPRADGVRGGLGPVHRAAGRRDGPLLGRPRPHRRPLVRCVARVPARRRHRHARARLDAPAGHRLHARAHRPGAENNVVNEVDRYIAIPAQALAYKIGQREILRLRAEARAAAGRRAFDIRAFHDAVLGHGAVGLETLGEIVRDWSEVFAPSRRDDRRAQVGPTGTVRRPVPSGHMNLPGCARGDRLARPRPRQEVAIWPAWRTLRGRIRGN